MASNQRTCYNRNGTAITDIAYQPCASDPTRDSPCCGTNHQGAGHLNVANDVCDPNSLCQNFEAFDGTNEGVKIWWRQGCTDPTWQSEACSKDVCNFGKYTSENAPVRKCGDGNWCCGEKSCCSSTSSLFKLAAAQTSAVSATPSFQASSEATTAVAVATSVVSRQGPSLVTPTDGSAPFQTSGGPIASPSAGSGSQSSSSGPALSVGAKAGIGVGIAVVVILLAMIALLLMKLRKRKQLQGGQQPIEKSELPVDGEKPYYTTYAHEAAAPVEMNGHSAPAELGTRHPVELPGDDAGHMKASQ